MLDARATIIIKEKISFPRVERLQATDMATEVRMQVTPVRNNASRIMPCTIEDISEYYLFSSLSPGNPYNFSR